jgi:hypothetical protein
MATASQAHPIDRQLSDSEFEELLQRTWEFVHGQVQQQSVVRPYESASESPSWT